jgi:hypothetical protein
MKSEVVATFTFLGDSPDGGDVDVFLGPPGAKNKSVRVRVRLGRHYFPLPRRGLGELIEALQKAKNVADEQYEKLVGEMNQERNNG